MEPHEKATTAVSRDFLLRLIAPSSYKIHTVFTENGDEMTRYFRSFVGGQHIYPDEIVINVRASEILEGVHPDYWPVPISYIRKIVLETGLTPVFVGQTRPSVYADALRAAFPNARFLSGNHWIDDFQTIRNAENVLLAVSSFSWMAGWLTATARCIFLPQLGLFNPKQRPDVDLCPEDDPHYIYEEFPVGKSSASPEQMAWVLAPEVEESATPSEVPAEP